MLEGCGAPKPRLWKTNSISKWNQMESCMVLFVPDVHVSATVIYHYISPLLLCKKEIAMATIFFFLMSQPKRGGILRPRSGHDWKVIGNPSTTGRGADWCRLEASAHALVAHRQPQTWPSENHGNAPGRHFFPLSQARAADSRGV